MNRNRLKKYKKILQFKEKQLDGIKQEIGVQQNVIARLRQTMQRQRDAMTGLESQYETQSASLAGQLAILQQYDLAMLEMQQSISNTKTEIASENEKLQRVLENYRLADQQLKSWEKLIERESQAIELHLRNAEMRAADERYLATTFMTPTPKFNTATDFQLGMNQNSVPRSASED
jgi:flagellar biosynthesis chaperone FliJ